MTDQPYPNLPAAYRSELRQEEDRVLRDVLGGDGGRRRKVLIVGGAGYVGSVLTDGLLESGYRVRCFDLLLYDNRAAIEPYLSHEGYEFVLGDIVDPAQITAALDGVTDVVLLACLVGDPITKKYPAESARINDDGYDAILSALNGHGLNKVVFVSTCSNYGFVEGDAMADETSAVKPMSLYAEAKVRTEEIFLALQGKVDYATTILRFATAFGLSPRMRFDLTVSEFTRHMFLGEELLVYDADTWRPYCHLGDFAELIGRVLEAPRSRVAFDVFNAGGDVNNATKQMIVDSILTEIPGAPVRYQEHGPDPRNYRVSFAKVRDRLFFEPRHTIGDGIRELVSAMRNGSYHRIDTPPGFYGNREIIYPPAA